jgi:hypothetical protein
MLSNTIFSKTKEVVHSSKKGRGQACLVSPRLAQNDLGALLRFFAHHETF